jgi:tetratricopeptide (TPR) repeat protein
MDRRWLVLGLLLVVIGCRASPEDSSGRLVEPDTVLDLDTKSAQKQINVQTYVAAAQLAESQGRIPDAIEQYKQALRRDGNNELAIFQIARLYTLTRQYPLAIAAWERYVEVTKQNPSAWNNLARTHEIAGNWREAEACYVSAINVDALHEQTRVNYGIFLARRGRIDEATEQMSRALPPQQVQYNLGSVYELAGDFENARAAYRNAVEMDRTFQPARQRLKAIENE